ncbi:alpha/beta fold hydrolase [Uliginosibacterium paludis]|uniref:Alpha/beta hydrolase n=1 Tax=Uliginosibacterium paludis TaxID=1615952 RepID=A0ABV2CTG8_9RHOO
MPLHGHVLFLPGASGNIEFWKPVAALLEIPSEQANHVGWPGFGPTPPDASVTSLPSLAQQVSARITRPTAVVAQSMGGVVALLVALEKPSLVTHLVLAALSGGIDMKHHGAHDWRPPREEINPNDPAHLFAAYDRDISHLLPSLSIPTLLLWGDQDPISPVPVGQWLSKVLPRSHLHVVSGGTHTFCNAQANDVAPLIKQHLLSDASQVNPRNPMILKDGKD